MGRIFVYILRRIGAFVFVSFAVVQTAYALALFEIEDGESAFIIDSSALEGWWVLKEECRKPFTLQRESSAESQTQILTSVVLPETVRLGQRTLSLRQNFRFHISPVSTQLEVYSSARGGWSRIEAYYVADCESHSACQDYMDLPEC